MKYSDDLVNIGRERLTVWRERAGDEADRAITEGITQPALESVLPEYCSEEDVDAVVVYQIPSGGWHCDILFAGASGDSVGTRSPNHWPVSSTPRRRASLF